MAHGNTVIHRNGVEFFGDTARCFNLAGDHLAQIFQVDVSGDELGERVDDGNNRFAEIAILHAGRAPKATRTRHIAAVG